MADAFGRWLERVLGPRGQEAISAAIARLPADVQAQVIPQMQHFLGAVKLVINDAVSYVFVGGAILPGFQMASRALAGECWYVLAAGIGHADEIPEPFGVMQATAGGALEVLRPAPQRPFTLPLALSGLISGLVLGFAKALGEFGATITFVANIPGQSRTIATSIYSIHKCPMAKDQPWHWL